ncbi:MAG: hypothetical protein JSS76_10460 [Bacteroidetes bacterium]|nr:hypothetical protein [Bacteroidota bacterium]MBS1685170.1 hypothetical protein [Bacteroidota bacterium]
MLLWELIVAVMIAATIYAKRKSWFSNVAFVRRILIFHFSLSLLMLTIIIGILYRIFNAPLPPGATRHSDMGDMALAAITPTLALLCLSIGLSLAALLSRRMGHRGMQVLLTIISLIMVPVVSFGLLMAFTLRNVMLLHLGPFH